MLTYELALLLRVMPKTELKSTLKRTAAAIFDKGGIIKGLHNLGTQKMPYKTSSHGAVYKEANYFVFAFSAPPAKVDSLLHECKRDVDIIRNRLYKVVAEEQYHCSLEEEMLPAPYRTEVIKMIEEAKKKEAKGSKSKFEYNSGMDYYPFQK